MPSRNPEIEQFAEALLCLGRAAGALDRWDDDVPSLADVLSRNEKLRVFLADPAVSAAGRCRALEELLAGEAHPLLVRFLQILVEQHALSLWPGVVQRFLDMAAAARQLADGEIVATAPLPAAKVREIETEVSRILGRSVRLRVKLDAGILGGMLVRVGDFVIDGSLDSRLDSMRRDLANAGQPIGEGHDA